MYKRGQVTPLVNFLVDSSYIHCQKRKQKQKKGGYSFYTFTSTYLASLSLSHLNSYFHCHYSVGVRGKKNHFSVNEWQNGAKCVMFYMADGGVLGMSISQIHGTRQIGTSWTALAAWELRAHLLPGRRPKPRRTPGYSLLHTERPMDLLQATLLSGEPR